uniref:Large ribosomal subunit protein bL32c n=1 Tax=Mychonastes jurisii TaxID=797708 RepID=A0A0S2LMR6_MYCJU|nr:ribosomal protein L32 [Mychonastes jurisii]ALO62735.1 ribosomal protein L32 [Mychonastes jurisii]
MAVPKKRMSKSKKNLRKNVWKQKIEKQATRALFLAKSVLKTESVQADLPNSDASTSET